jgi:type I restriction enzyme S subunit
MKAGWKTVKLGEIAEIYNGNTISDEEKKRLIAHPNEGLAFIATKDVGFDGVINYENGINIPKAEAGEFKVARNNAVLVCAEGGSAGRKIGHVDRDVHFGNKLFALNASTAVHPRYLYHFCLSEEFRKKFKGMMAGLIGGVSIAKFKLIEIPLPPLAEQKRIVALLDDAFAGIDEAKAKAEANQSNSEGLYKSYLQSALSNGNESWPKRSLEDLLNCGWIEGHLDGNHGSDYPKKEEFVDQGVPYISANCLQDEEIDMTRAKHLSTERAARLRKGIAKNHDVLFAHNATVGPVALLRTNEEKVILGTSLTYYRCNPDHIDPEYLAHYMRSSLFKRQYEQIMRQSTRNQIPITKQREFFHIIPPINEQRALVVTLAKLFEAGQVLCRIYGLKCSKLDELRHSLLSQAFAGELTA